jgi:hypothetical protein
MVQQIMMVAVWHEGEHRDEGQHEYESEFRRGFHDKCSDEWQYEAEMTRRDGTQGS